MEWVWEGQVYHHEQGCDNSVLRPGGPSLSPLVSSAYFTPWAPRAVHRSARWERPHQSYTWAHAPPVAMSTEASTQNRMIRPCFEETCPPCTAPLPCRCPSYED